jgi:hypothetical protein
MDIQETRTG